MKDVCLRAAGDDLEPEIPPKHAMTPVPPLWVVYSYRRLGVCLSTIAGAGPELEPELNG
jgi:hypothetical protein